MAVIDPFCCNQTLCLGPTYITFTLPLRENCRLVQSHQFVAKLHQKKPNCVINFKKISVGDTPGPPYTVGSAPDPWEKEGRERGGEEESGGEEERGREGGEGIIHLLLPQAHTAVTAYATH